MISITEVQIKELLGEAFEAGWYGSKDMKESVVEDLVSKIVSDLMHQRPLYSEVYHRKAEVYHRKALSP